MEMNELISFVTNNGIAVVLMVYFLRNNHKSTTNLIEAVLKLTEEVKNLRQDQNKVYEVINNCKKVV